jgi:hypothetical protein
LAEGGRWGGWASKA